MLTPAGLVENLVFGLHAYLREAYWTVPPQFRFSADHPGFNWHYLYVFLQSNGIEVLFLTLIWPRWRPALQTGAKITALNSVTHPIVIFALMKLPLGYLPDILIAETFAIVAEGAVYRRWGWRRPFLASLVANILSWQLGPVLTASIFLWDRL